MRIATSLLSLVILLSAPAAFAADWTPETWAAEDTIQFRSDCPEEGEHWSYIWMVVLDGAAYVRLGSQSAGRFDCSTSKPLTSIRVAGQQFDNVEMIQAPEMAERVAAAMHEKYWSDFTVSWMHHPYTMRLTPKPVL